MSPDSVLHMLHRVLKRAGLPKVRFHDLRHFHATLLLDRGASCMDVAIQLGHTDNGELVRRTYGHPDSAPALERIASL